MVDWAQFKINSYEKETTTFEEMIYLLFCSKYGREEGIFSYVNQPGIETEPIEIDGECIGFQAKYYTDRLSAHTKELIDTIETSKRRYPNLTKIEIYTNSQYGPGREKGTNKPKSQIKVENIAKANNIKIEWFVKSNLDEILALEKNKIIHDKFFGKEKSSLDYIIELNNYSESMFDSIENKIVYNENKEIKLDRNVYLQNISNALSEKNLLIISGKAGCGKSALVKEFHETKKSPFLMFKADDFEEDSIQDLYNRFNLTLGEFRDFYKDSNEKFIYIDSVEKISHLKNQRTIEEFLKLMVLDDWKIILTSRNDYSDILRNNLNINQGLKANEIKLPELTIDELEEIFRDHGLTIPVNSNIKNPLQNLFYLRLYLSNIKNINPDNNDELKNILWEIIIKQSYHQSDNHHEKREHCFLEFVKNRSINPHFKFKIDNICSEIINEFQRDGIIEMRYGRFFITHDVYEDWALEKIINNELITSNGDYTTFLNSISNSLKFNDAFRNWICNKLIDDYEEASELIDYIITNEKCDAALIDETILAVLQSNTFKSFLTKYKYLILKNDYIFERILYWLKTVFIIEDDSEFSKVIKETSNNTIYKPYGKNWKQFISFLYDNLEKITERQMEYIIPSLLYWNKHYPKGETTRYSSLIALKFYKEIEQINNHNYKQIKQDNISIILLGANEIKQELEEVLQKVISNNWKKRMDPYYDLSIRILSSTSGHICEVIPKLILKLAKTFWICNEEPDCYRSSDAELFSIDENTTFDYHYASAFETPIHLLLTVDSKSTIDFIIDFVNVTTENCAKNTFDNNRYSYYKPNVIKLNIDNKKVTQYISNSLWQCYRGTSSPVMPKLLESIHMALERFLLTECDKDNFEDVERIMKHILGNSKSASLTAVVNSITLAFPDKFFDIALILFKTIELFIYDTNRLLRERETKTLYGLASNITEKYMINERLSTINQKFRKNNLESLLLRYQYFSEEEIDDETFKQRLYSIQSVIDQHKKELKSKKLTKDEMDNYRILLSRNDRRNLSLKTEEKDNQILITFENNNLDEDLKEISDNSSKAFENYFRYVDLSLWANAKLKHEKLDEKQIKYENDLKLVLDKFKGLIDDLNNNKCYYEPSNTPLLIASCLLTFYSEQLNSDDEELCEEVILANIYELLFNEEYFYQISHELNTGINVMSIMFDMFPEDLELFMIILLLILFNDEIVYGTNHYCDFAIITLRKLYKIHPNYVNDILCCYSIYKQKFDDIYIPILKENRDYQIHNPFALAIKKFLEKYENELEDILKFNSIKIENLDLKPMNIIFQVIPIEITLDLHYEFIKDILPIFSKELFDNDSSLNDSEHFIPRYFFLNKLSLIILENKKYLNEFISPFLDNFLMNDGTVELLDAFCRNVNENTFNEFWDIWWMFLDKIKEKHATCREYNLEKVFKKFILNYQYKIDDELTHEVNELEKQFYGILCKEFSKYEIVLDLISKIVIKDKFILSGLNWLYNLLNENNFESIKKSTVTNLDNYIHQYILKNVEKIKINVQIQNKLSIIINLLISNNSSNAYRFNKWLLSIK
ncbi:hypothetical protein K4897_03195 [Methanobrevibacter sp. TLL-48-HuF1]|uniref:AAA family ATPase n=1 Tax=Methanobrevibacter sp. TLL-48-HuF1 TaxID=2870563 RepID=UPI002025CA00|nr:AAA family ATPase [Methanobrevibacter sp. TLL-48-HuF1]URN50018.1 hypothetical protein K4897_03195 [Methanobrevibacter sp. TLL-48-HuF1]